MRLPQLSLDEARRLEGSQGGTDLLVVVAQAANAWRLVCVDAQGVAAGLTCELTLMDARAIAPTLRTVEADPQAYRRRLDRLADACRRYTPLVATDQPDGLWMDITGCGHLFDDEAGLTSDLMDKLQGAGFEARYGIGDTPGIAWALSGFRPGFIAPPGARAEVLAPLPPAALRVGEEDAAVLGRLGVRTIAQLQALGRDALARRLGIDVLARLDAALGVRGDPLSIRWEVASHLSELRLAESICSEQAVLDVVRRLAADLQPRLEAERKGGRCFRLELFRVDGALKRLCIEVSRPLRDPYRIAALFAERLATLNEGLEADYGFDVLRLVVDRLDRLEPQALTLASHVSASPDPVAFVDSTDTRLGSGSVLRLSPEARTRTPELAVKATPFAVGPPERWREADPWIEDGTPLRPLRLFTVPEPIEVTAQAPEGVPLQFRWRCRLRRMVKGEGPERLAPEWWRPGAGALTRDYYRVEDREGRRYWLFRQGLFSETEGRPRWFVHGLFP